MILKNNLPIIYTILWAIYNLQGVFGAIGSTIGLITLVLALLIGLFFVFYVNTHYFVSKYIKAVNILLAMLTVYALYYIFISDVVYYGSILLDYKAITKTNTIKYAYMNFFPLYVYYWSAKKKLIDPDWMKKYLYFWFIVSIIMYVRFQTNALLLLQEAGVDSEGITNNIGSEFLALIPLLLLVPLSMKKKMLLLVILSVLAFSSFKRGTMFICIVFILIFVNHILKTSSNNKKIFIFLGVAIVLGGLFFYLQHMIENNQYMQNRWESTLAGNSSGRDVMYDKLWNNFQHQPSLITKFFGQGTDATVGINGNWAHNDWLELLICQGILGVIVFVIYFWGLWNDRKRCLNVDIKCALTMVLIMFALKSIFSMSYPGLSTTVILGYSLANLNPRIKY